MKIQIIIKTEEKEYCQTEKACLSGTVSWNNIIVSELRIMKRNCEKANILNSSFFQWSGFVWLDFLFACLLILSLSLPTKKGKVLELACYVLALVMEQSVIRLFAHK